MSVDISHPEPRRSVIRRHFITVSPFLCFLSGQQSLQHRVSKRESTNPAAIFKQ